MDISTLDYLRLALVGYFSSVLIETSVLLFALAKRYSVKQKIFAGFFLTAYSYPFVLFVFPFIWNPYRQFFIYALVSELFAPISECAVFYLLFHRGKNLSRSLRAKDYAAVVLANLASFIAGIVFQKCGGTF